MAVTKLTLNAERALIGEAKRLARARGDSVSGMFARFLTAVSRVEAPPGKETGPITRRATGLITRMRRREHRAALADALADKYGFKG